MSEPYKLAPEAGGDIYTVSRLNQEVRLLLESAFPLLWVEGEVSNLARPGSGHWYFSLKDPAAQVRCAMFRNRNLYVRHRPRDGDRVLVRARVGLYPARGDFQLVVEHMEPAGDGALRRAFEELKARLEGEGLFDDGHKRPLPAMPRRLGVITSPTGAAVRDVLTVLRRRFPAMEILIYPVAVQGSSAAAEIADTIRLASRRKDVDALLLTRGGGSLEDLWAFNEEIVARAIHECELPLVSAVGHEVDFTIADFAADHRAPTPSAGAEALSPDGPACLYRVGQLAERLSRLMELRLTRARERAGALSHRLATQHPGRRLQDRAQRVDELEQRLAAGMRRGLGQLETRRRYLTDRLMHEDPRLRIRQHGERQRTLTERLARSARKGLSDRRYRLDNLARALDAVSPLATLGRGYAIACRDSDGAVLREARDVRPGDRVVTRVQRGELISRVESVREPGEETICPVPPSGSR